MASHGIVQSDLSDWLDHNLKSHSTNTNVNVNVCLWNAWSIVNKLSAFQAFVSSTHYKILAVTESWLSPFIFNNEIISPDFFIYQKDRDNRGGGVFLAVHQSIPSKLILSPASLEIVSVELTIPEKVIICVIYIPPNAPISYTLSVFEFLSNIAKGSAVIFLGDFNSPDINWNNLNSSCNSSDLLCDFVCDYNFIQLVQLPTHIRGNILDLVLTTELFISNQQHLSNPQWTFP